jgi:hypothetical protein
MARIPKARLLLATILTGCALLPVQAQDNMGVAQSVQQQIQRCWNLPAGFDGQTVVIDIVLLGDGSLEAPPEVSLASTKAVSKLAPLIESAVRAVERCAPFGGLDRLGVTPDARLPIKINFQS